MLGRTKEEIFDYIKDVENLMDRKILKFGFKDKSDFLVVDRICCIKNFMDKKIVNRISLGRIILMGRSANVFIY